MLRKNESTGSCVCAAAAGPTGAGTSPACASSSGSGSAYTPAKSNSDFAALKFPILARLMIASLISATEAQIARRMRSTSICRDFSDENAPGRGCVFLFLLDADVSDLSLPGPALPFFFAPTPWPPGACFLFLGKCLISPIVFFLVEQSSGTGPRRNARHQNKKPSAKAGPKKVCE